MRDSRKGGLLNIIIIIVIALMSLTFIYLLFGEQFVETGERFLDEASDKASHDFLAMKLKLLESPVGEDECSNGIGLSHRSTSSSCEVDNDYDYASSIRDCCCCNVTGHVFDFGQMYAYKNIQFKFEPHSKDIPIEVQGFYSKSINPTEFKSIPDCSVTFNESNLTVIDKTNKEGYILSCYVRETPHLEEATFRYVELRSHDQAIDYAEAEVYPAIRICEVDSLTGRLEPGKGYWVYSQLLEESNVTIPGWDYLSPIAIIQVTPHSAFTEEDISFSGINSFSPTPGCSIVSYEWDFGDGTTGTGVNTIHSYELTGIYRVKLTVREATNPLIEFCDGQTGESYTYVSIVDQYPRPLLNITYEGFYWEDIPL